MLPAIELREASAGYPGHVVLRDIDLVIHAGERVAVMGRSGAGKTTLLNLLYQRTAERIALIPQAAALVKPLSVFHNVYMGRLDRCSTWHNLRTLAWPARRDVDEVARGPGPPARLPPSPRRRWGRAGARARRPVGQTFRQGR